MPSYQKASINQEVVEQGSDTLVILLPGNKYTNFGPLLYYAYNASLQLGYDVLAVDYGFQKVGESLKAEHLEQVIAEARELIEKCLDMDTKYNRLVFIGKCTGTGIQAELIETFKGYEQLNVFLTPMPRSIEAINNSASLVIVGTHDGYFTQEHIERISGIESVQVRVVEGANHDLEVDDFEKSIDILKAAVWEIYRFIS